MSLQRSQTANLSGYGEARYPRLVADLAAKLVNGAPLSAVLIEAAARRVPGRYQSRAGIRTADDYIWLRLLEFRLPGSARRPSVAIAIPHASDYSRADGSQLDRMPAVYLRYGASVDDGNAILGSLIAQL